LETPSKAGPVQLTINSAASDLVFYGTLDRWFKALDAKSGKELWKFQVVLV
jgi:glucose dehydrogenase